MATIPTYEANRSEPDRFPPLASVYHPDGSDTRSCATPKTAVEYPTRGELFVKRNTKLASTDWLHTDRPANAKNVYSKHRPTFLLLA
jgi:hypothetical protein